MGRVKGVVRGKWRQLYLNNNLKKEKALAGVAQWIECRPVN